MKKIVLPILILSLLFIGCSKENISKEKSCKYIDFKYYKGKKDHLGEISNNYLLIGIDTTYSDKQIKSFISKLNQFDKSYHYSIYSFIGYKFKEIPLKFKHSKTCIEITKIIDDLKKNKIISYVHYTMQTDDCTNAIEETIGNVCVRSYGSNFYVEVFDENNLTDLKKIVSQTNTELLERDKFMPKWFLLRATKSSKGDALKMANYFYETGLFQNSEPDITQCPVE